MGLLETFFEQILLSGDNLMGNTCTELMRKALNTSSHVWRQVIWEWDALLFAEEDTVKHWTCPLMSEGRSYESEMLFYCRGGHSKALKHVLSVWRPGHMRVRCSSICRGGHSKALNMSSLSEGQVIWEWDALLFAEEDTVSTEHVLSVWRQVIWEWDALLFAEEDTVKHWTCPLCLKARSYESETLFYLLRRTQ